MCMRSIFFHFTKYFILLASQCPKKWVRGSTRLLIVPRVLCIVHKPIHHLEDVGVVNLVDSTGCMNGYITCNCLKMHKGIFQAGSAIVLENCSLFINKIPLERHINIHDENVIAVYTNQS